MPLCLFQHTYSRDDCTFREQILPDGYNVYISEKHGALLSLGNQRQRMQGRDRGVPTLAQFLPRISILEQASAPGRDIPDQQGLRAAQTEEHMDSMDSFGKLSQIIHSPSFHKRWDSSSETSVNTCVLGCFALSEAEPASWHIARWLTACPASLHLERLLWSISSTVLSNKTKCSVLQSGEYHKYSV